MTEKQICNKANELVEISINLYNKKTLKNYDLLSFFKEYLNDLYDSEYYDCIISKYCSYLAKAGYEIRIDTDKFDIIDYNSNEYSEYILKLISKRPKNYNELQNVARITAQKIISMYQSKKYCNQSFKDYLEYTIPKSKYTNNEKVIIEVGVVHHITHKHYDIYNTSPLVLNKF